MTIPISVGDLVLRDGRAEEVKSKRYQPHPGVILLHLSDWVDEQLVTRIGSTHDGWRVHTGHARPESVGPDDFVEAVWNHGQRLSHPESAGTLPWGDVGGERIVAYRVVPSPCGDPQPDRTAEVRAVAAEMRIVAAAMYDMISWKQPIIEWADRLDPQPVQKSDDPRLAVVQDALCRGMGDPTRPEWAQRILDALDAHAKEAGR